MRVSVFDHQGRFVRSIGGDELIDFEHTDELNGEDSLRITTTAELRQGYRLVWRDRQGHDHEHVCQDPAVTRELGAPVWTDDALCSVCETLYDHIDDRRPYGYSYGDALAVALEPTRWEVGTVDQPGRVSGGLTFYRTSARKAINQILECGGELEVTYETERGEVTARRVGIRAHRGEVGGHRRFAYRKDLRSLTRTEHWGAITACYGYGKGVETESGGYGRKLTFGDINDGKDYVEDLDALEEWGRPSDRGITEDYGYPAWKDMPGTWADSGTSVTRWGDRLTVTRFLAHVFGTFEDGDCEDAATLLQETRDYLEAHKVPGVTYEADVVDLVAMGREWEGVGVGDDVQIVDSGFAPTLRCSGRVTKLVTDYVGGTQEVTLGNVTETLADEWSAQQAAVGRLADRSGAWDMAAEANRAYLERLVSSLNERFNVAGASYTFTSFEQGTIWASVPMDEDGRPTRSGGQAIQICSQGFRIADGTKSDGSWDWRAFGTGRGFTASELVSGVLRSADGESFYLDLESSELRIGSGASLGGSGGTVGDLVSGVEQAQGTADMARSESAESYDSLASRLLAAQSGVEALQRKADEQAKWLSFDTATGLTIGADPGGVRSVQDNDSYEFRDASGTRLLGIYADTSSVVGRHVCADDVTVGRYRWLPTDDGDGLRLAYVGGAS